MKLMNRDEQRDVLRLLKEAAVRLDDALTITTEAQRRIVNGNVNTTIQYQIQDAARRVGEARKQAEENPS